MSRRLRDLFVEPLPSGTAAPASRIDATAPGESRHRAEHDAQPRAFAPAPDELDEPDEPDEAGKRDEPGGPVAFRGVRPRAGGDVQSVAVLAAPGRVQHATAAVAMGLARTSGRRCALAHVVGAPLPGATSSSPLPAARGAAARLRRAGRAAFAVGRLVWVGEGDDPDEPAGSSGSLPRLADAFGVPAALGVALPRTAQLDRALAAHDGLVLVREPDATDELEPLVLASLAALGPAVVTLSAPSRVAGQLAASGIHAPATALAAVRNLFGALA